MTRRIVRLGALLALGLVLQLIEGAIAIPVLLPGAKLGLANVATLLVLAEWGPGPAAAFGPARHLLAAVVGGTLFLPTFWLGAGGSLTAAAAVALMHRDTPLRTAGVISGALFQVGQAVALVCVTAASGFWWYLPPLLALGVGAGWTTGALSEPVARVMVPGRRQGRDRSLTTAAALLAAALGLSVLITVSRPAIAGTAARVFVAGQPAFTVSLAEAKRVPLSLASGNMILEVRRGAIRVVQADCPDQLCVKVGWVSAAGRSIYCATHQVLVTVEGVGGQVDGVVR